jgi:hypothetical protein
LGSARSACRAEPRTCPQGRKEYSALNRTGLLAILFLLGATGLAWIYYANAAEPAWSRGFFFVLSAVSVLPVAPIPMWYTLPLDERPPVVTAVLGTIAAWLGFLFLMWMFLQVTGMGFWVSALVYVVVLFIVFAAIGLMPLSPADQRREEVKKAQKAAKESDRVAGEPGAPLVPILLPNEPVDLGESIARSPIGAATQSLRDGRLVFRTNEVVVTFIDNFGKQHEVAAVANSSLARIELTPNAIGPASQSIAPIAAGVGLGIGTCLALSLALVRRGVPLFDSAAYPTVFALIVVFWAAAAWIWSIATAGLASKSIAALVERDRRRVFFALSADGLKKLEAIASERGISILRPTDPIIEASA